MSWEYSGFLAEKIEAGRQLLASDPAFEGSEELQVGCRVGLDDSASVSVRLQAVHPTIFPSLPPLPHYQEMVKDKDLTDALWRAFLRPNGRRRQGLSAHDKRQGLVLFLHCVKHKLRQRSLEVFNTKRLQELKACLTDAVRAACLPAGGQGVRLGGPALIRGPCCRDGLRSSLAPVVSGCNHMRLSHPPPA